jgi:hypothetical protein
VRPEPSPPREDKGRKEEANSEHRRTVFDIEVDSPGLRRDEDQQRSQVINDITNATIAKYAPLLAIPRVLESNTETQSDILGTCGYVASLLLTLKISNAA